MTVGLVTLYSVGIFLLLAGLAAVWISYRRTRADNARHQLLNETAALLLEGRVELNDYHKLVRDQHDACVTKMGQLMTMQESMEEAKRAMHMRRRVLEQTEAMLGFTPEKLGEVMALNNDQWEVTGLVMRHIKSQVEVKVIERDHTWSTVQPRQNSNQEGKPA
jgi:hypothetical protein